MNENKLMKIDENCNSIFRIPLFIMFERCTYAVISIIHTNKYTNMYLYAYQSYARRDNINMMKIFAKLINVVDTLCTN